MPCYFYFAKGLHENWRKVSCQQAFRRKLLTATAKNHRKSKVTFVVFNSSFNVVRGGGMVSSFVIYVNAWDITRTFLMRYKKQYCRCFQICYGNSLLYKARLITCSSSNFFFTTKSLLTWVWSYSLIFSVAIMVVSSQSGNHRKSFTLELVQSFAEKPSSRTRSVRESP